MITILTVLYDTFLDSVGSFKHVTGTKSKTQVIFRHVLFVSPLQHT